MILMKRLTRGLFRELKRLFTARITRYDAVVQDNTLLADNQLLTWGQNKESKVQIMSVSAKREDSGSCSL